MKIISVVGARPQFIKLAPLVNALRKENLSDSVEGMEHIILHTGQHYDYEMNKVFFNELGIPEPDHNLEVGSASPGRQIGEMIQRTERVLIEEDPHLVLVYGDTNSTFAGALAATKLQIPVAHVEAGLRSYNRRMPEEVNRVLTDHISEFLFCPTENACQNLKKEGFVNIVNGGKIIDDNFLKAPFPIDCPIIINVGDIMFDSVLLGLKMAEEKVNILQRLDLVPKSYYLATIHRPENSDNKNRLKSILAALNDISRERPVVFPVHPRTKKNLNTFKIGSFSWGQIRMIEPVSYFEMLILEKNALKILTDSGGMQKEAYFLEVPCVTLREETEWVETLEGGFNILAGADRNKILAASLSSPKIKPCPSFPFGDGRSAERILHIISLAE